MDEVLPFEPDYETNYEIELAEDGTIHFEVDAYDPDGTDLTYECYLNWETIVSTSSSYDFNLDTTAGEQYNVIVNIFDEFSGGGGERDYIYYEWLLTVTEGISSPQGLPIEIIDSNLCLNWNEVSTASQYNIYESDSPDIGFEKIDEVIGSGNTSWNTGLSEGRKFYYVTAE